MPGQTWAYPALTMPTLGQNLRNPCDVPTRSGMAQINLLCLCEVGVSPWNIWLVILRSHRVSHSTPVLNYRMRSAMGERILFRGIFKTNRISCTPRIRVSLHDVSFCCLHDLYKTNLVVNPDETSNQRNSHWLGQYRLRQLRILHHIDYSIESRNRQVDMRVDNRKAKSLPRRTYQVICCLKERRGHRPGVR